jgi:hypothetical protein
MTPQQIAEALRVHAEREAAEAMSLFVLNVPESVLSKQRLRVHAVSVAYLAVQAYVKVLEQSTDA